MIYASGADLQTINSLFVVHPLAREVQNRVLFLTVAEYDSAFTAVPRLASWQWSEDSTEIELTVRDDVTWHDGVPTTARDVAWTLEMAVHPDVQYPRASDLATLRSVQVSNDRVLTLVFDRKLREFPDVLTDLAILPHHLLDTVPVSQLRNAEFNRSPTGNGPFRFVEYRPNQRWVFERVDWFPDALGKPSFERFVVAVVDEATTKLAGLTTGELHFAGVSPAHSNFVRDNPELELVEYPVLFTYGLFWNTRRPPFDDIDMRRALTRAIDRRQIVNSYIYGFGSVAAGPVPAEHPLYRHVDPLDYDPEAAAEVMDGLGWLVGQDGWRYRNRVRLSVDLYTVGTANAALEQLLQSDLARVGVEVRIRQRELGAFLDLVQSGDRDFDALVTGVPGTLSLSHVAALFSGDGPIAYSGVSDGAFDSLVSAASNASSRRDSEDLWAEAQLRLYELHPVTWLYHPKGIQGKRIEVEGASIDLRGELMGLRNWRIQ